MAANDLQDRLICLAYPHPCGIFEADVCDSTYTPRSANAARGVTEMRPLRGHSRHNKRNIRCLQHPKHGNFETTDRRVGFVRTTLLQGYMRTFEVANGFSVELSAVSVAKKTKDCRPYHTAWAEPRRGFTSVTPRAALAERGDCHKQSPHRLRRCRTTAQKKRQSLRSEVPALRLPLCPLYSRTSRFRQPLPHVFSCSPPLSSLFPQSFGAVWPVCGKMGGHLFCLVCLLS